jgi:hypothetical protein
MREVRLFLVSRSSRPCIAVLLLELAEDSDSTGDATDERRGHRRSSPAGETKVWKHRARRRSQGRLEARVRLDHDCRRQERGTVQSTSLEHASPVPRGHTPAPRLAGKSITPPSLPAPRLAIICIPCPLRPLRPLRGGLKLIQHPWLLLERGV